MSEHQRQTAFLKALILEQDTEEHRRLQDKIHQAERDERCINRAMRLVGIMGLLSVSGLGYLAVLLPDFFENSSHFLIKTFSALALGSLICFVVFLGLWLWHRALVNRALEDGRKCILAEHHERNLRLDTAHLLLPSTDTRLTMMKLDPTPASSAQVMPALSKVS